MQKDSSMALKIEGHLKVSEENYICVTDIKLALKHLSSFVLV